MKQKWRKHSPEFKEAVELELLSGKRNVSELAREKRIKDSPSGRKNDLAYFIISHYHQETRYYDFKTRIMQKPLILAVDHDRAVLNTVARDLRQKYGRDYRVIKAESGASALDALRQLSDCNERVALLVFDQRMPCTCIFARPMPCCRWAGMRNQPQCGNRRTRWRTRLQRL